MEIVITIKETKEGCTANIKADFSLSFESVKDAEKWAESCKSDIERLEIECDCPKCRAEKEAQTAKPEPEELAPAWTPEVGMLIQSEQYGVWEITGIKDGGVELVSIPYEDKGFLLNVGLRDCKPIAELEGLEVGESVFAIKMNGDVYEYRIYEHYDKTFWVESNSVKFPIGIDGVPLHFGNGKQMFWRTAERAERFGK